MIKIYEYTSTIYYSVFLTNFLDKSAPTDHSLGTKNIFQPDLMHAYWYFITDISLSSDLFPLFRLVPIQVYCAVETMAIEL